MLSYTPIAVELVAGQICINQKFSGGRTIALTTKGVENWATYPTGLLAQSVSKGKSSGSGQQVPDCQCQCASYLMKLPYTYKPITTTWGSLTIGQITLIIEL